MSTGGEYLAGRNDQLGLVGNGNGRDRCGSTRPTIVSFKTPCGGAVRGEGIRSLNQLAQEASAATPNCAFQEKRKGTEPFLAYRIPPKLALRRK